MAHDNDDDRVAGKGITAPQSALAKRIFGALVESLGGKDRGGQTKVAAALDTSAGTISRAMQGKTSLRMLLRAAQFANTPPEDLRAAGVPVIVASSDSARDDALRMLATEEGISAKALAAFLDMRGAHGLGHLKLTEALAMMRMLDATGRPIAGKPDPAAVDHLFGTGSVERG